MRKRLPPTSSPLSMASSSLPLWVTVDSCPVTSPHCLENSSYLSSLRGSEPWATREVIVGRE